MHQRKMNDNLKHFQPIEARKLNKILLDFFLIFNLFVHHSKRRDKCEAQANKTANQNQQWCHYNGFLVNDLFSSYTRELNDFQMCMHEL